MPLVNRLAAGEAARLELVHGKALTTELAHDIVAAAQSFRAARIGK
jgi:hypothetical protein